MADGKVIIDTELNNKGLKDGIRGVSGQLGGLKKTISRIGAAIAVAFSVRAVVNFGKACIDLGSDLQEVQNVVDVTFATMNKQVDAFAQNAAKTAGLSETMAKRYVGTFGAMAKSFDFTEKEAFQMSTTLAQLSGDVASFYNISQDEAFTKLKSVFSGETESLKDLGIVMTQTALDEFAMRKGINMTTSEMTEQQKVALRYQFVLEQLSGASGDFQRTSAGWANQTRLLSLQFQQLKATIGQGLINVLTPVIQVINKVLAKLQVLAEAFRQITAALFGDASAGASSSNIAAIGDDYNSAASGAENFAGGIADVGSAAKKAQKQLLGFDEITKLDEPDTGGGSAGGGGGGASGGSFDFGLGDMKPPDVTGTILDPEKIQKAADLIKKIAEYIPVIATGLAGLGLGKLLANLLTANIRTTTLGESVKLLGRKLSLIGGITLTVTGIALETKGIISSIKEGLNKVNFMEILGGGGAIAAGGALVGKFFGNAIIGAASGGILAGVPAFITGIYDACVNGIDWLSAALIPIGSTAAGAGIGAMIGSVGGPLGALIGVIVGAVTDLGILIVQKWDVISEWLKGAFSAISEWFSGLWESIQTIWGNVSEWFKTSVIDPVVAFFSGMWQSISQFASNCWTSIKNFFKPAVNWFSELFGSVKKTISDVFHNIGVIASGCWQIIKEVWSRVSSWFDENVIQPVAGFFSDVWDKISGWATGAWESIKSVFSTVSDWFNTNLIQPVGNFFSDLWDSFKAGAVAAWEGVKSVFSTVGDFFRNTFEKAWRGIVNVFSAAGDIFVDIKDGIVSAFKAVVNALIKGINSVVRIPFDGINYALKKIRDIEILGLTPFSGIKTINVPQIPYLAQGAVLPPNKPFMAMVGDQKNGTNVEAPLATIQEALVNALAEYGGGQPEININFTGDLAQLARILKPVIDTENRRIGTSLARG